MKKFTGYEETKAYTEGAAKLPVGGYVLKVQNVRFEEGQHGNSDRIMVAFDVAEGEQKGFFQKNFDAQTAEDKKWKGTFPIYCPKDDGSEKDGWTKRRFKTIMEGFEESNPGYAWNWDENTLKGKLIGGVFGEINTIIDGKDITYVGMRFTHSVDSIRNGKFKVPDTQYKNGASPNKKEDKEATGAEGFMKVDVDDEEIPF